MLGALLVFSGWVALGGTYYPESFRTTGRPSGEWYWLSPENHAQWEFLSLPPRIGTHVSLEAFLCLALPGRVLPAEAEVRFQLATVGSVNARLYLLRLHRVQVHGDTAMYFGQLILACRDLELGSRLSVKLAGTQSGVPLGVHSRSLRISDGRDGAAIASAPAVAPGPGLAVAGQGGVDIRATAQVDGLVRALPNSPSREKAPFLAPGTYRGELGWPGTQAPMDGEDWCRINLRRGQVLILRLQTEGDVHCTLCLFDPAGRLVGEVAGSWVGLEYRADRAGAWQVLILCREGRPQFTYTLTVSIKEGA